MVDIISAKYVQDYKIELVFEDGVKGLVDLKDYANKGGVFSSFSDMNYFKKIYLNKELGTICWPEGLDIAPETLYSLVTGKPFSYKQSKAA